jgi:hypothetical protein
MPITFRNRPVFGVGTATDAAKPKPRTRRRTPEELAGRFPNGIPIITPVNALQGRLPADKWLDTQDAGYVLGVSPRTLELWRHEGTGPPCKRRDGKSYQYRFGDLQKFLATYRKWGKRK